MPDPVAWDVIFGAGSDQVVLGIDFPGRREAGFPELAARLGPAYKFLRAKPRALNPGRQLSGDAYVGPWIEDIEQGRHQVVAVLGYRVGSVYAAMIAEGISRWQPMPKVILFDPQFSSTRLLGLEFYSEISALSSLLSDAEIERSRKVAVTFAGPAACGVAAAAAEMTGIYWEISTTAFERAGLGSAYDDKLIAPFESYISWLSVADEIDPCQVWKRSTAIVSSDYREPAAADANSLIGWRIPFDVGRADLLRSDSVAEAVRTLLAPH